MVLFTILCDTCASRLQVKQQAAIGQVLACPKCGSMVHVQPPEGWVLPESLEAPPKKTRPPRNPHDSQATLSGEFGNIRDASAEASGFPTQRQLAPPPETQAPPIQETVEVAPANHWEADGSAQRGKALAWLAGILGICLIALVLILYMVSRMIGGGETDPGALADNRQEGDQTSEAQAPPAPLPAADPQQSEGNDTRDGDSALVGDADDPPPPTTDPTATDPGNAGGDSAEPPISEPSMNLAGTEGALTADADREPVLNEEAALVAAGDSITMQAEQQQRSLLDQFAGVGDLVFNPGIDMEEFREATADDPTHKYGIGKVYVPVPRALEVNPEAAIQEIYPGISFKDQPLIEFARSLFALTQVPVALDSDAIVRGRLDPLTPVTAAGKNITPATILQQALDPLQLTWQWDQDRAVILITPQVSDEIQISELVLDPVLGITDDEAAQKLLDGIQLVVEPLSWNSNGGSGLIRYSPGKLTLEQTQPITDRVRNLVEKLVMAAQLKANPGEAAISESLATLYSKTKTLRESPSKVLEIQQQPVQQLLRELQQQDGVTLLVNWSQALKQNWNPNVTMPWLSKDLTMEATLRDLVNSMDLAYRFLDENTWEITSKQKYWSETRLEIYPCYQQHQNKFSGDQIMEFLKEGIAADLPRDVHTPVIYSPNYQCIVAVLPEALHIRVEKILQQLAEQE